MLNVIIIKGFLRHNSVSVSAWFHLGAQCSRYCGTAEEGNIHALQGWVSVLHVRAEQYTKTFNISGLSWVTDLTGHDKVTCLRYFFPHSFSSSYLLPLFHCLISILLSGLSGRIGKVVASHAVFVRSIPAEVALIYTMHEALRGYCPWRLGVRPVNWIYRLWRHYP